MILMKFLYQWEMMSKKKYEDMSFEELQEAYIKEYCAQKKATERIEELQVEIDEAGARYKKLQAEMNDLQGSVRSKRGMISECSVILDEIGKAFVRVGAPETEKKPVKRTRMNSNDNDS